jgi:hypothetical protein
METSNKMERDGPFFKNASPMTRTVRLMTVFSQIDQPTHSMPLLLRLLVLVLHLSVIDSFAETTKATSTETCAMSSSKLRSVRKVLPKPSQHWVGDGFKVYPVFANLAFTEEISPLLMFDYAEPRKFPAKVGAPLGVGSHPHRGFETVTLAFQGEVEHHDSTGKSGVIGAGDVQWMTAGRGIIHQEYHSKEFTKSGGNFEVSVVSGCRSMLMRSLFMWMLIEWYCSV